MVDLVAYIPQLKSHQSPPLVDVAAYSSFDHLGVMMLRQNFKAGVESIYSIWGCIFMCLAPLDDCVNFQFGSTLN